jgi:hypothetical protein
VTGGNAAETRGCSSLGDTRYAPNHIYCHREHACRLRHYLLFHCAHRPHHHLPRLRPVAGSIDQTGAWDAAGQSRTILLSDGSRAHEKLTNYSRPQHFSYIVSGFTGMLRFLTLRARGEWHFEEHSGGTSVRWSYTFEARSVFTFPLLFAVVRPLWQAYMRKALREALAQLEASASA